MCEGMCSEHTRGPRELGEDPELTRTAPHPSEKPNILACTLTDTTPHDGVTANHMPHRTPEAQGQTQGGTAASSSLTSLKMLGPKVLGDRGLAPRAGPWRTRGGSQWPGLEREQWQAGLQWDSLLHTFIMLRLRWEGAGGRPGYPLQAQHPRCPCFHLTQPQSPQHPLKILPLPLLSPQVSK